MGVSKLSDNGDANEPINEGRRGLALSLLGALGTSALLKGCGSTEDTGQETASSPDAVEGREQALSGTSAVAWVDTIFPRTTGDLATKAPAQLSGATLVIVKGCLAPADGGGGIFYWVSGAVTDDGGTLIVPSGNPGGGWKRLCDREYSAKWFGAGLGAADDSPALTAAVTVAAANGGGVIHLPAGVYRLSSSIAISGKMNIVFRGDNGGGTQLFLTNNNDGFVIDQSSTHIQLRNFTIFGGTPGGTSVPSGGVALKMMSCDNCLIENVEFHDLYQAVYCSVLQQSVLRDIKFVVGASSNAFQAPTGVFYMRGSMSIRVENATAVLPSGKPPFPGDVIALDSDCDTVVLAGCEVGDAANGYHLKNSLGQGHSGPRLIRIVSCYAERCSSANFNVEDGRDVRITACEAAGDGSKGNLGYVISGGTSISIDDCLALQHIRHGFYVTGGSGVKIAGCTASNNSYAQPFTHLYDGIRIETGVTNVRLIGNRSGDFVFQYQSQRYGISISGGQTNSIICVDNDLTGNYGTNGDLHGLFDASSAPKVVANNLNP